jgi:hydrogenase maturation protease
MGDDAIGFAVASELRKRRLGSGVEVYAFRDLDLSLIELLRGATAVVLIDALKSGRPPGAVSKYSVASRQDVPIELPSLHGLLIPDIVALAGGAGLLQCPITIIGVEPKNTSPGRSMSRELREAVGEVVNEAVAALDSAGGVHASRRASGRHL